MSNASCTEGEGPWASPSEQFRKSIFREGKPATRIAFGDRPWLSFWSVITIGPIVAPTVRQVRDCLAFLAKAQPGHPLVSRIDRETMQWQAVPNGELDSYLRAVVVEGDQLNGSSFENVLVNYANDHEPDLPLKVIVGPESVTLMASHAVGDGRFIFSLLARLASCADKPQAILEITGPTSDHSTVKALTDFYGRQPGRLLDVLRLPRPAPPTPAVSETGVSVGSESLSPKFIYQRFDRQSWRSVRAIRNARYKGVSVASVLFSLTCAAFGESDIDVDTEGFFLLVDNRRYLRGAQPLSGNMAKSVYLKPGKLDDPKAIDTCLQEVLDTGRPLLSAALSAITEERSRRRAKRTGAGEGWKIDEHQVNIGLSFLSHTKALDGIPWINGDEPRWCGGFATTGTASGISITFIPIRGELHLSVSFVPEVISEASVRASIDRLQSYLLPAQLTV